MHESHTCHPLLPTPAMRGLTNVLSLGIIGGFAVALLCSPLRPQPAEARATQVRGDDRITLPSAAYALLTSTPPEFHSTMQLDPLPAGSLAQEISTFELEAPAIALEAAAELPVPVGEENSEMSIDPWLLEFQRLADCFRATTLAPE